MSVSRHRPELTIIVPTYNSYEKMTSTLSSLREATDLIDLQVLFIDDHSSDGTFEYLHEYTSPLDTWSVHRLAENSGSAARPRNRGVELAEGSYLYFLDSDDIVDPKGIREALDLAFTWDYDIVRTALRVKFGDGSEKVSDTVPGWDKLGSLTSKIRAIVRHQSLTCSFLMKKTLIDDFHVRFDEERRIGEDIKFTAKVLCYAESIGLRNIPSRTYVKASEGTESVTQSISSAQFTDFVRSWEDVESQFSDKGISFLKEHGYAAVFYALKQFIWFKSEDLTSESFAEFSRFCIRNRAKIIDFPFIPRYQEIIDSALEEDYEGFLKATQLRFLVAGHDLKFLRELLPKFGSIATVKIDQWAGHTQHDEVRSQEYADWADLIWCEWLLGSAVWYSRRIRNDQKLIVRVHRSEMTGNYGAVLDWNKVAAFIAVSPHTLGDFSDRFDIPRSKFHLIPNGIAMADYERGMLNTERLNRIAMVGILPKLKGFKKAIALLAELKTSVPDFEMWVYGKRPEELDWLMRIEDERVYYDSCSQMIANYGLEDSIKFQGWVDTKSALSDVGFVLSLSDFEGQHLALVEAFASGGVGMSLNWRGASQNHLREFVFRSPEEMAAHILALRADPGAFKSASEKGRQFAASVYDIDIVWEKMRSLILSIRA